MTGPAYVVLAGISLSHFLNDTMQSLIASVYPILKENYALDFAQIGMITLAFQFTASLLQPVIGHFTDKKAQPFSLAIGMGFTFFGLLLLSVAQQYPVILIAAALVGLGSAVFHPESARIARLASGGRYGFAQSVFQLGGSFGTSMGPLLAALIVVPFGQPSIAWFSSIAFLAIVILWRIGLWYRPQIATKKTPPPSHPDAPSSRAGQVRAAGAGRAAVLQAALCLEPVELLHLLSDREIRRSRRRPRSSISSCFSPRTRSAPSSADRSAIASAANTCIWFSILGALPFTLALPYAGLVRQRGADGLHRPDHFLGDVVDHRVRAGVDAASVRHDFRRVLRMSRSASAGSAPRCSARSPTIPASTLSISSARSCRRSGCSRCSCRRCRRRALTADGVRNECAGIPSIRFSDCNEIFSSGRAANFH